MVYIATHLSLCARRLTVVRSTADPLISCAAISQPRFRSCAAPTLRRTAWVSTPVQPMNVRSWVHAHQWSERNQW